MVRIAVNRVLILLILPVLCTAAPKGELDVSMKNGILLNKVDANQQYMRVSNTLMQSVGGNYTIRLKQILISAGVDVGYEHYNHLL